MYDKDLEVGTVNHLLRTDMPKEKSLDINNKKRYIG